MIVYRVAPQAMDIKTVQIISMTESILLLEGRNGVYRKSRTYGGAQHFLTSEEARQFIIAREQDKIRFFEERLKFHRARLIQAESGNEDQT